MFAESRYRALELRTELLGQNPDTPPARSAEAERLIGGVRAYIATAIKANLDDDDQIDLWIGRAKFLAVRIRYDYLEQPSDALVEMEMLLPTLKGKAIYPQAASWQLRRLLDEDDIRAGTLVESLVASHPDQARAFLQEATIQLRRHTNAQRYEDQPSEDLKDIRARYGRLATELLLVSEGEPLEMGKRYIALQLCGDAMIGIGNFEYAKKCFQETFDYDQQRREDAHAQIEKKFDVLIAAVQAGRGSPEKLIKLAEEYFAILASQGIQAEQLSGAVMLASSLRRYQTGDGGSGNSQRLDDLANKLSRAFGGLKRTLIASIPVDVTNHHGLARCFRGMGDTAQAMKFYDEILASLTADNAPELYWPVLLERCEVVLEAYGDDRAVMDQLAGRIAHLLKDPRHGRMGGLTERFEAIAGKAE